MTFLYPVWLVLLLLGVVPWLSRRRDWRHGLIRTGAIACLVLALARPAMLREDAERAYHVYVHEASAAAWVGAAIRGASSDEVVSAVAMTGSLSTALEAAAARIPEGSRGAITLVSKGDSTDRHWGQIGRQLLERRIPVHVVALDAEDDADLRLLTLRAAKPMRVGQEVEVMLEALNVPGGLEIELVDADTGQVLAKHTQSSHAERLRLACEIEPPRAGFMRLGARAGGEILERTFAVEEPLQVLYLGQRVRGGAERLQPLLGQGIALRGASGSLSDLGAYDAVILDDLPAERLSGVDQERLLTRITEGGMGLLMSGGMAAFGPGGYFDSVMAKALPVEFMQREEKRDPSTTLVVIIDTSGSMSGERVQLAKEVARLAIRRLLPHDKVGIVEFYGTKQWAAPIQSAANAIDIQRALNRLDAGGGTVIMPAIEEAYYAMQNVETRYKHVLVLTDGGVESGEFEPLLRKMAAKGMNVSTVLVGGDTHSEFLVKLANWGKGHFYSASNRFSIPEILLKQPSTSKIPAYRPGEHAVVGRGGLGWWGSVDAASVPGLAGYVETRPRDGAEVLLETAANEHPILATWKLGLGRVSAFTTEPTGPGTRPWRDWEHYGPWLARVLARTAREERHPFAFEAERYRNEVTVRALKLVEGELTPTVEWLGETPRHLSLERRAPAVFTATLVVDPRDEVRLLGGVSGDGSRPRMPFVSNSFEDSTPVDRLDPEDRVHLEQLAAETGGRHLTMAEATSFVPQAGGGTHSLRVVKLWNLFLLLALLFFLGDLLYRRWPTRDFS